MNNSWQGKAVSIQCVESLGIFQGTIKEANSSKITIVRAFRNGLPLRTLDTEITINANDIIKLDFIPILNNETVNGAVFKLTDSTFSNNGESALSNKLKDMKVNKLSESPTTQYNPTNQYKSNSPLNVGKTFANMIPAKVEIRLAASAPENSILQQNMLDSASASSTHHRNASKPIDIKTNNDTNAFMSFMMGSSLTPNKIRERLKNHRNNQAFGTPTDNIVMDQDFDFEKNLALFDKQAIWDKIEKQPNSMQQKKGSAKKKNYRHDENILASKPTGFRQIKSNYNCFQEFSTDDGLIIPSVPLDLRTRVQEKSESSGLSWERQCDMLARGSTEISLLLLGGSRRLTPNNQHQWPTIVIICDQPYNEKHSEIGLSTGRQLASHGLKVSVYVKAEVQSDRSSKELDMFAASGNANFISSTKDLPAFDLVILSIKSKIPNAEITKLVNDSRSPILAIDPPIAGIPNVTIKYSIIPILPVDGISPSCGKLYLCNLGIPDKYYNDAGIKYKSPFGHKFVIPLHLFNTSDD